MVLLTFLPVYYLYMNDVGHGHGIELPKRVSPRRKAPEVPYEDLLLYAIYQEKDGKPCGRIRWIVGFAE